MRHLPTVVLFAVLGLSAILSRRTTAADKPAIPRVLDDRLILELVVAEPDLVTPTGLAVDHRGRVLVVESHTHFRPAGYSGPTHDRLRVIWPSAPGATAPGANAAKPRITIFFEGTSSTMNVAVHPDGSVYLATRKEILRLRDTNDDGQADEKKLIAQLVTAGDYPHNGLSGFAFDFAGNVYFGLGENLGEKYELVAADHTKLAGKGEGGNIYVCRPDGSGLRRVATGFWNPFHLATDSFGRLFAVDNDPDSSPPCRLLHVVEGGDYGFRFRLGRDGLHPFQSWNGEIPGTLPMVAGTGEAPSGVLAYESDGLPSKYVGDLLVTSWGDHRIERHRLVPHGASYRSRMTTLVQGGEDFRPVGIALAPDGSLYVSDWVKRDYNLHRHGRVWRLRAKEHKLVDRSPAPLVAIRSPHRPTRETAAHTLARVNPQALRELLEDDKSPLTQATAISALGSDWTPLDASRAFEKIKSPEILALLSSSADLPSLAPQVESQNSPRGVLAAYYRRQAQHQQSPANRRRFAANDFSLADPFLAQAARQLALRDGRRTAADFRWAPSDDAMLTELLLHSEANETSPPILDPYLRTPSEPIRFLALRWIGEQKLKKYRDDLDAPLRSGVVTARLFQAYLAARDALDDKSSNGPWDRRSDEHLASLVTSDKSTTLIRRLALRQLRADHPKLTADTFKQLLATPDDAVVLEAVRTLRESRIANRGELLAALVRDEKRSPTLRAEATMGLSADVASERSLLQQFAVSADATTAAKMLQAEARRALRDLPKLEPRPPASDLPAWEKLLALDGKSVTGDPSAGERIFFHPRGPGCYRCHQVSGRGGRVGPDLSVLPSGGDRRRLLDSLLNPSREIAPQFVADQVLLHDGTTFTGTFLGEDGSRNQRFADPTGKLITVKADQIAARKPLDKSLMPDDLTNTMPLAELQDLLAYLLTPR